MRSRLETVGNRLKIFEAVMEGDDTGIFHSTHECHFFGFLEKKSKHLMYLLIFLPFCSAVWALILET